MDRRKWHRGRTDDQERRDLGSCSSSVTLIQSSTSLSLLDGVGLAVTVIKFFSRTRAPVPLV